MNFSIESAFLESKKEDSVTWPLEVCLIMLKNQKNMAQMIITDRYTSLMNSVANDIYKLLNLEYTIKSK